MRRIAAVLVLTALLSCAVACTSTTKPDERANKPPTTQTDPREAAVRKTLLEYREAYLAALKSPQEGSEELAKYATGRFLVTAQTEVASLLASGRALRDSPKDAARVKRIVVKVDGGVATARLCEFSDQWIVEASSERPVNTAVTTDVAAYHLLYDGSHWKIDGFQTVERSPGDVACGA